MDGGLGDVDGNEVDIEPMVRKMLQKDHGFLTIASTQINQIDFFTVKFIEQGALVGVENFSLNSGGVVFFQACDCGEEATSLGIIEILG